jgi:hypothetical protein
VDGMRISPGSEGYKVPPPPELMDLGFDGSTSTLVEKASHIAVAFRRTVAARYPCAFFIPGTLRLPRKRGSCPWEMWPRWRRLQR